MNTDKRIWEIDFLRGIAIILMIIFHLIVDLKDFHSYPVEYLSGFWCYIGKISAILFILISGISSTFSRSNIKRGLIVLGFGMILTVTTYFFSPSIFIKFGILHFLGISMVLSYIFRYMKRPYLLILAAFCIIIGNIFTKISVDSPWLFPIGLISKSFTSMDYYPLFPWLGVFICGIIIGKTLYVKRKSLFSFTPKNNFISFIGRHSLFIYLVHQPILLAILQIIYRLFSFGK